MGSRPRTTDGQLLRRAGQDPETFAEFYDRHETIVAGYLVRQTRDPELAADLTSETFATALLNAKRFRDDGQPAIGWLLGIARHALLHTWERGQTERRALDRLGLERLTLTDASLERVEALCDDQNPNNPLHLALSRLPDDQRDAVRARVLDERSYDDLAAELGVSTATVRQRVSRGVDRLRTTLNGRQP